MTRKKYVTPELDVLILEQSDIITRSGNIDGDPETGGDGNGGILDSWE